MPRKPRSWKRWKRRADDVLAAVLAVFGGVALCVYFVVRDRSDETSGSSAREFEGPRITDGVVSESTSDANPHQKSETTPRSTLSLPPAPHSHELKSTLKSVVNRGGSPTAGNADLLRPPSSPHAGVVTVGPVAPVVPAAHQLRHPKPSDTIPGAPPVQHSLPPLPPPPVWNGRIVNGRAN